jgi:hypothetical protein
MKPVPLPPWRHSSRSQPRCCAARHTPADTTVRFPFGSPDASGEYPGADRYSIGSDAGSSSSVTASGSCSTSTRAIHWMVRYSVLPLVILVLGHSVPWAYLFVGQSMMLIIGTLTFLPGGAGGVDLTLAALLHPHLPPAVAATAVLAWRFCMFHWYLIAGAPVFLATTGLGRGVRAPSTDLRAGAAENVGSVSRGCNADSPKEIDQP